MVVDTVKKAENGDGFIVRVYETYNMTIPASLAFTFPLDSAEECNLLEEKTGSLVVANNTVSFTLKPFEIRTFRIRAKV